MHTGITYRLNGVKLLPVGSQRRTHSRKVGTHTSTRRAEPGIDNGTYGGMGGRWCLNKREVRLGRVNARLLRRRVSRALPILCRVLSRPDDKHACNIVHSVLCADWEQKRTFNGVRYPFKRLSSSPGPERKKQRRQRTEWRVSRVG